MSNPWFDYKQNFKNNLPPDITYRDDISRFIFLSRRFAQPWQVIGYRNYLIKTGNYEAVDIVEASGGIETVINPEPGFFYRVHTFLENGTLDVHQPGKVEYLVIAGGGGSGTGGGGAGWPWKYVSGEAGNTDSSPLALTAGAHTVTVGAAGQGSQAGTDPGENGGDSELGPLLAPGGGGGGRAGSDGLPGGNGGGAAQSGSTQASGGPGDPGFRGGDNFVAPDPIGGGGGGASERGQDGSEGGGGGDGILSSISGVSLAYAGGGRSNGSPNPNGLGQDGPGGGGDGELTAGAMSGQPGIVIIRYRISEAEYLAEAA